MTFFESLKLFFEQMFFSNRPEVKTKMELHELETRLENLRPNLYQNKMATVNLAELFFILYSESKKIEPLLNSTIFSDNETLSDHYFELLIKTGFSKEQHIKLLKLSYNNMKDEIASSEDPDAVREEQQKNMNDIVKYLTSSEFDRIDKTLAELERLKDICCFDYASALSLFGYDVNSQNNQTPTFHATEALKIEKPLLDLLYLISNFRITASLGRALIALGEISQKVQFSEEEKNSLLSPLKKMSSILARLLNKDILILYLKVIKNTNEIKVDEAVYEKGQVQKYAHRLQKQFTSYLERINSELQTKRITDDLNTIFPNGNLAFVNHYNEDSSNYLTSFGFEPFRWVTPMQILKTFIVTYFGNEINSLLNDIIVEGFFCNPSYKTEFAQKFYACAEAKKLVSDFENSFEKEQPNDIAVMRSWAREGNKNPELSKKLVVAINNANSTAHTLIENLVTSFNELQTSISNILDDSRKTNADVITNIKLIFTSTRNKDYVALLEKQFAKWENFIEIMRNYVIISKSSSDPNKK